jgi:hypothetical protein
MSRPLSGLSPGVRARMRLRSGQAAPDRWIPRLDIEGEPTRGRGPMLANDEAKLAIVVGAEDEDAEGRYRFDE